MRPWEQCCAAQGKAMNYQLRHTPHVSFPSNYRVARVLEPLSSLAKVPAEQTETFVKRLSEVIWRAWRISTTRDATIGTPGNAEVRADISRFVDSLNLAVDVFDRFCPSTRHWLGEGTENEIYQPLYSEMVKYRETVSELLAFSTHLYERAVHEQPEAGGQVLSFKRDSAPSWEPFVADVLREVWKVGGRLTVNRNDINQGTLHKFLRAIEGTLPSEFLPRAFSARALERIKKELEDIESGAKAKADNK